jgi:hypothetical protein
MRSWANPSLCFRHRALPRDITTGRAIARVEAGDGTMAGVLGTGF